MTPDLDAIEGRDPVEVVTKALELWVPGVSCATALAALEQLIKEREELNKSYDAAVYGHGQCERNMDGALADALADLSALREQLAATEAERDELRGGIHFLVDGEFRTGADIIAELSSLRKQLAEADARLLDASQPAESSLREQLTGLVEALEFYADPETYVAIGFFPDRPCGAFIDDFGETDTEGWGHRPGERARKSLALLHPKGSTEEGT